MTRACKGVGVVRFLADQPENPENSGQPMADYTCTHMYMISEPNFQGIWEDKQITHNDHFGKKHCFSTFLSKTHKKTQTARPGHTEFTNKRNLHSTPNILASKHAQRVQPNLSPAKLKHTIPERTPVKCC